MTDEIDALLIRSLPELNDAANRLDVLSDEVGKAVDREIADWIQRNDWRGEADFHGKAETWLAPHDWMVPNDPKDGAYLYFQIDETGAEPGNHWHVANYAIGGVQQLGLWLYTNTLSRAALNRLFRSSNVAPGLPMDGAEFFLPLRLDRTALANAVENNALVDAMTPIRETLDRLPAIAKQLEPLKQAIVAASET